MNNTRLVKIGLVIAMIAVVALGWLLIISPNISAGDAARAQRQQVQTQNDGLRASLASLQRTASSIGVLRAELASKQVSIPSTPDTVDFYDEVYNVAGGAGVTVSSITSADVQAYGAAANGSSSSGSTATAPPAPSSSSSPAPTSSAAPSSGSSSSATPGQSDSAAAGNTFSIAISIKLTGSPDQILAFSKRMQQGGRLFLVTGVNYTGGASQAAVTGSLTGYVFVVGSPQSSTAK